MESVVCDTVSHTAHPFVHMPFLAKVHCKESLVWIEVSDFCSTIDTGLSLGFPLDILVL